MSKTIPFQTIQFCISMQFEYQNSSIIRAIQFNISTQFSSTRPIDRTLSGAATPGQRGPGGDGSEGVLYTPQNSSITGTSSSNCLVPYPGHSLGGLTPLQRCSWCILPPPPIHLRINTLRKGLIFVIPLTYWLNTSTTTVLLQWHLWHWITLEGWYAVKERNQNWTVKCE